MKRLNVEIKARCNEHDRIRGILRSQMADFKGTDHQIDIYFRTTAGRLKLREGKLENYLVFYQREDGETPKESKVVLFESEPGSPLKEMLASALGVLVVVAKKREIYFIGNVKFHLDLVEGLGTFVEIEAIDADGSIGKERLLAQCNRYVELLGICVRDLVASSYSDLLLRGQPAGSDDQNAKPPKRKGWRRRSGHNSVA